VIDIIVANLIFWPIWIAISHAPEYLMQKVIDSYDTFNEIPTRGPFGSF